MPLTDQELEDKFHELAAPVIGATKAKDMLASCWSIDRRGVTWMAIFRWRGKLSRW